MKKRTSVKNYPWSGDGTEKSPYEISSEEHLTTLAGEVSVYGETFECNFFKLTNNIELTDDSWEPIGNRDAMFDGHFDGNGYTISNVVISGTQSNCGLFAYIGENAVISNFKIFGKMENTKGCSSLGMLVGSNYGTIENCTCETEATITFDVGGSEMYIGFIAGINNAAIEECTVKGTFKFVKKNSAVQGSPICIGGIVASNYKDASIKQCEVFGEIRTEEDVCGIAYENSGTIENCTIEQKVFAEIPDNKVLRIVDENNGTLNGNLIKVVFSDKNAKIAFDEGVDLEIKISILKVGGRFMKKNESKENEKIVNLEVSREFKFKPDQSAHYGNVRLCSSGYLLFPGNFNLEIDELEVEKDNSPKNEYEFLIQLPKAEDGEGGKNGKNADSADVKISIHKLKNSIRIKSIGSNGGNGSNGIDGMDGGDGGDGFVGGIGGNSSNGGNGGNGGRGGDAPKVTIEYAPVNKEAKVIVLSEDNEPCEECTSFGGKGGKGGEGGKGGKGGKGGISLCNNSHAANGNDGVSGLKGNDGNDGNNGKIEITEIESEGE